MKLVFSRPLREAVWSVVTHIGPMGQVVTLSSLFGRHVLPPGFKYCRLYVLGEIDGLLQARVSGSRPSNSPVVQVGN
jgi:hypothetical protein